MLSILVTNNRSMSTLQKQENILPFLRLFRYLELLLAIGLKSEICKTFQLFDG